MRSDRFLDFLLMVCIASLAVGGYFLTAILTGQSQTAELVSVTDVCRYKLWKSTRELSCSDPMETQKLISDGYHYDAHFYRADIRYQTTSGPKVVLNIFMREQDRPDNGSTARILVSPMISRGVMPTGEAWFFANFFWLGLILTWPSFEVARRSSFWHFLVPNRFRINEISKPHLRHFSRR